MNFRMMVLTLVLVTLLGAPASAQSSAIFVPLPQDFSDETIFGAGNLKFSLLRGQGRNTIIAWGPIAAGDDQRLRFALTEGKPVQEIQLFSNGGDLAAGLNMGRIIRSERLSTRIVSGAICASACNFIFMGGVVRTVEPGGRFAVHMFSNKLADLLVTDIYSPPRSIDEFNDRYPDIRLKSYAVEDILKAINQDWIKPASDAGGPKAAREPITMAGYLNLPVIKKDVIGNRVELIQESAAHTSAVIAEFLVEMRMPLRFLTRFARVRATKIEILSQSELRDFNIVN